MSVSGWRYALTQSTRMPRCTPARGQAYFDYACPLSGSVEPLQLRFDAHFVRSGKLPSDP